MQNCLQQAQAAFDGLITFASLELKQEAWSLVVAQLESRLTLVLESIGRLKAEAKVELNKLLQQAKTAALKAFDQDGFLEKCLTGTCAVEELFQVIATCHTLHFTAAISLTLSSELDALVTSSPQPAKL